MLTVDYDRLGAKPGDLVLDMGCGAGRHAFETVRRGCRIVALDQDLQELVDVSNTFAAMIDAGELPHSIESSAQRYLSTYPMTKPLLANLRECCGRAAASPLPYRLG